MEENKKLVPVTLRLKPDLHKNLRKLAFLTERSLNDLISESIQSMINNNKKVLTNSDIIVS